MRSIFITLISASVLTGCVLPIANVEAQEKKRSRFDVGKFLTRLDRNENGKVEPGEIPDDRTRGFLEKSGVDVSKSIDIKSFSSKIKKEREEREERESDSGSSSSRSPGFAVDRETETSRRFEVSAEERDPAPRGTTFNESAKKAADWTLKKYDKNRDGRIDSNEMKAARWSNPGPDESDTNNDGSLSRNELLMRYQKREDAKEKSSDRRRGGRRSDRDDSSSRDRSSSRKSSSSSSSSNSSDRRDRDIRKGYENFVNGIFKAYDKNQNGYLSEDEVAKMRNKPADGADADKDKRISRDELINSYVAKANKNKKGSSSGASGRSNSDSRSNASSAGNNPRPQLTAKDKNGNGQIEMAEFSDAWTSEVVAEFYAKDKDKDGIITAAEWNDK